MSFLEFPFWACFSALLVIYYLSSGGWQNRILIATNLVFIFSFGWVCGVVHVTMAFVTFMCAKKMETAPASRGKLLFLGIAAIGGLLLWFKARAVPFTLMGEQSAGLFPIGLSLNACQLVAYLIEVKWERTKAEQNVFDFLLFSSFFVLITSGPIERYGHLMPQFAKRRKFKSSRFLDGLFMVCLGCFKKFVIANPLSAFRAQTRPHVGDISGFGLIAFCVLGFFELYADFSGYIDIARGFGLWLGIELPANFDQPYFAKSLSDIWRRWNITLVSWLTDFAYMPILLKTRNLYLASAATILLAGLWHGISLSYLCWALYWVALFMGYIYWGSHSRFKRGWPAWATRILTYAVGVPSMLAFVVDSWEDLWHLPHRLLAMSFSSVSSLALNPDFGAKSLSFVVTGIAVMIFAETVYKKRDHAQPQFALTMAIVALVYLTSALGDANSRTFVYMRF